MNKVFFTVLMACVCQAGHVMDIASYEENIFVFIVADIQFIVRRTNHQSCNACPVG